MTLKTYPPDCRSALRVRSGPGRPEQGRGSTVIIAT